MKKIADFIGCGYQIVAYWCVHGNPDNLDSLRDKRRLGNYRKATEAYIELLLKVDCTNWDMNLTMDSKTITYLSEQTGIELRNQSDFAKKKVLCLYLANTAQQNKTERVVFREKLATYLKAGVVVRAFQAGFWDETGQFTSHSAQVLDTSRSQAKVSGLRSRGK